MNNVKKVVSILFYLIKAIFIIVFHVLKFVLMLIPVIFSELFKLFNRRLRFSITFKTTATYMFMITIILLLLGTAISSAFAFFLYYQDSQSLSKNSQVIAGLIKENAVIPQDKIERYAKIEGISVSLIKQSGQILYQSAAAQTLTAQSGRTRVSSRISLDPDRIYYEAPVTLPNEISKIHLTKSLDDEIMYLQNLVIGLGGCFLFIILITALIGSLTSRKMLRPIDNMTRTARYISAGDLNTRLDPVDSHDELKELAITFNEMLDRIQHSFDQQNVFVSDASHELRTPISVIQGYANLLQRWGTEEPDVLAESITAIKSEAEYMKELVEKLLFLASTDKKKQRLEVKPFPLHELIDELIKESRLIDADHQFDSRSNDAIMLPGDRSLIKQALRIFIDNSRKFTPSGGMIEISSRLQSKRVLISVKDNGIGIAPEDLPHVFNRFYKADKSRTREGSGAGLGLSIAKWIIEQHGGELKAESILGQGTVIMVFLPLKK